MDTTQFLLTIVLSLSTLLLVIIGIQLVFVLKEVKKTINSINKIISGFESLGVGLHSGLSEVTGFMNGFKTLIKVADFALRKKNEKSK